MGGFRASRGPPFCGKLAVSGVSRADRFVLPVGSPKVMIVCTPLLALCHPSRLQPVHAPKPLIGLLRFDICHFSDKFFSELVVFSPRTFFLRDSLTVHPHTHSPVLT